MHSFISLVRPSEIISLKVPHNRRTVSRRPEQWYWGAARGPVVYNPRIIID